MQNQAKFGQITDTNSDKSNNDELLQNMLGENMSYGIRWLC